MIGHNRGQIIGRRLFLQNSGRIWNVIEQRSVREERAARDENDTRLGLAIAGKIRNRKSTAFFQHQVQHDHIGSSTSKVSDGFVLALQNDDILALPAQMARPDA